MCEANKGLLTIFLYTENSHSVGRCLQRMCTYSHHILTAQLSHSNLLN